LGCLISRVLSSEDLFTKVRDTVTEVDRIVSLHKYPSDRRTVMVMGLLSMYCTIVSSGKYLAKSFAILSAAPISPALAKDIAATELESRPDDSRRGCCGSLFRFACVSK
jgi:hypothetical protein